MTLLLSDYRPAWNEESPAVLNGGEWVRRGLVLVWQQTEEPMEEPEEPTDLDGLEFIELIACFQCGASVSEHCRSSSGQKAKDPHAGRTIKRVCACMGSLGRAHRYCQTCRARNDKQRKLRYERRVRGAA